MTKSKAINSSNSSSTPGNGKKQVKNSREHRAETHGPSSDATLGSTGPDEHREKRARFAEAEIGEADDENDRDGEEEDESSSDEEDDRYYSSAYSQYHLTSAQPTSFSSPPTKRKRQLTANEEAQRAFGKCARWIPRAFTPFIKLKDMCTVVNAMAVMARGKKYSSREEYKDSKAVLKA